MSGLFIEAIIIKYDPVNRAIDVDARLSTFENLGLLEAAKAMITNSWLNSEENEEGKD